MSFFKSTQPAASLNSLIADPSNLEVPVNFADLKEVYRGTSPYFIIHIQDPHSNLSGQENLARSLDTMMARYGISLVMSEGGEGDCSLTPLRKIAPPAIWKQVAKKYLFDGQIAGEEYLNLTSEHPMKIVGIEDMGLYMACLNQYAMLVKRREAILEYLSKVRTALNKLKTKLYPKELYQYDALGGSGWRGDMEAENNFEKRFEILTSLASSKRVDLAKYPNMEKMSRLKQREKSIDYKMASVEQGALFEELVKLGVKDNLMDELKKVGALRNRKLSLLSYFRNTLSIAKEKKIDLNVYPNLLAYVKYLEDFAEINLDEILREYEKAEDLVYLTELSPATSDKRQETRDREDAWSDARTIRAIDRYVGLLETAYRIQMTTDEFKLFRANERDFITFNFISFINRKLLDAGYGDEILPYIDIVEKGKKPLFAFYNLVRRRDEVFIQNAEKSMQNGGAKVAVLISGGYHTENLTKLFREHGYSYAVLTPIVTSGTNQKKYEKVLLKPIGGTTKIVSTGGDEAIIRSSRQTAQLRAMLTATGARFSEDTLNDMASRAAELAKNPSAAAPAIQEIEGQRGQTPVSRTVKRPDIEGRRGLSPSSPAGARVTRPALRRDSHLIRSKDELVAQNGLQIFVQEINPNQRRASLKIVRQGQTQSANLFSGMKMTKIWPGVSARVEINTKESKARLVIQAQKDVKFAKAGARFAASDFESRYATYQEFVTKHEFVYGQTEKDTVHWPTPTPFIRKIFAEINHWGGPIEDKSFLEFGYGDFRVSLAAQYLYGAKVIASENSAEVRQEAAPIIQDAISQKLIDPSKVEFRDDALALDWSKVDIAYMFYTEPMGPEARWTANWHSPEAVVFRKTLRGKIAEMKSGSLVAVLYTQDQWEDLADAIGFGKICTPIFKDKPVELTIDDKHRVLQLYMVNVKTRQRAQELDKEEAQKISGARVAVTPEAVAKYLAGDSVGYGNHLWLHEGIVQGKRDYDDYIAQGIKGEFLALKKDTPFSKLFANAYTELTGSVDRLTRDQGGSAVFAIYAKKAVVSRKETEVPAKGFVAKLLGRTEKKTERTLTYENQRSGDVLKNSDRSEEPLVVLVFNMRVRDAHGRSPLHTHYFLMPESRFNQIKGVLGKNPGLIYEAIRTRIPGITSKFDATQDAATRYGGSHHALPTIVSQKNGQPVIGQAGVVDFQAFDKYGARLASTKRGVDGKIAGKYEETILQWARNEIEQIGSSSLKKFLSYIGLLDPLERSSIRLAEAICSISDPELRAGLIQAVQNLADTTSLDSGKLLDPVLELIRGTQENILAYQLTYPSLVSRREFEKKMALTFVSMRAPIPRVKVSEANPYRWQELVDAELTSMNAIEDAMGSLPRSVRAIASYIRMNAFTQHPLLLDEKGAPHVGNLLIFNLGKGRNKISYYNPFPVALDQGSTSTADVARYLEQLSSRQAQSLMAGANLRTGKVLQMVELLRSGLLKDDFKKLAKKEVNDGGSRADEISDLMRDYIQGDRDVIRTRLREYHEEIVRLEDEIEKARIKNLRDPMSEYNYPFMIEDELDDIERLTILQTQTSDILTSMVRGSKPAAAADSPLAKKLRRSASGARLSDRSKAEEFYGYLKELEMWGDHRISPMFLSAVAQKHDERGMADPDAAIDALERLQAETFLEVGPGNAVLNFYDSAIHEGYLNENQVYAIDPSLNEPSDYRIRGKIENAPDAWKNKFNRIFASKVLKQPEIKNIGTTVDKLFDLLKPGGELVVYYEAAAPQDWLAALRGRFGDEKQGTPPGFYIFTKADGARMAEEGRAGIKAAEEAIQRVLRSSNNTPEKRQQLVEIIEDRLVNLDRENLILVDKFETAMTTVTGYLAGSDPQELVSADLIPEGIVADFKMHARSIVAQNFTMENAREFLFEVYQAFVSGARLAASEGGLFNRRVFMRIGSAALVGALVRVFEPFAFAGPVEDAINVLIQGIPTEGKSKVIFVSLQRLNELGEDPAHPAAPNSRGGFAMPDGSAFYVWSSALDADGVKNEMNFDEFLNYVKTSGRFENEKVRADTIDRAIQEAYHGMMPQAYEKAGIARLRERPDNFALRLLSRALERNIRDISSRDYQVAGRRFVNATFGKDFPTESELRAYEDSDPARSLQFKILLTLKKEIEKSRQYMDSPYLWEEAAAYIVGNLAAQKGMLTDPKAMAEGLRKLEADLNAPETRLTDVPMRNVARLAQGFAASVILSKDSRQAEGFHKYYGSLGMNIPVTPAAQGARMAVHDPVRTIAQALRNICLSDDNLRREIEAVRDYMQAHMVMLPDGQQALKIPTNDDEARGFHDMPKTLQLFRYYRLSPYALTEVLNTALALPVSEMKESKAVLAKASAFEKAQNYPASWSQYQKAWLLYGDNGALKAADRVWAAWTEHLAKNGLKGALVAGTNIVSASVAGMTTGEALGQLNYRGDVFVGMLEDSYSGFAHVMVYHKDLQMLLSLDLEGGIYCIRMPDPNQTFIGFYPNMQADFHIEKKDGADVLVATCRSGNRLLERITVSRNPADGKFKAVRDFEIEDQIKDIYGLPLSLDETEVVSEVLKMVAREKLQAGLENAVMTMAWYQFKLPDLPRVRTQINDDGSAIVEFTDDLFRQRNIPDVRSLPIGSDIRILRVLNEALKRTQSGQGARLADKAGEETPRTIRLTKGYLKSRIPKDSKRLDIRLEGNKPVSMKVTGAKGFVRFSLSFLLVEILSNALRNQKTGTIRVECGRNGSNGVTIDIFNQANLDNLNSLRTKALEVARAGNLVRQTDGELQAVGEQERPEGAVTIDEAQVHKMGITEIMSIRQLTSNGKDEGGLGLTALRGLAEAFGGSYDISVDKDGLVKNSLFLPDQDKPSSPATGARLTKTQDSETVLDKTLAGGAQDDTARMIAPELTQVKINERMTRGYVVRNLRDVPSELEKLSQADAEVRFVEFSNMGFDDAGAAYLVAASAYADTQEGNREEAIAKTAEVYKFVEKKFGVGQDPMHVFAYRIDSKTVLAFLTLVVLKKTRTEDVLPLVIAAQRGRYLEEILTKGFAEKEDRYSAKAFIRFAGRRDAPIGARLSTQISPDVPPIVTWQELASEGYECRTTSTPARPDFMEHGAEQRSFTLYKEGVQVEGSLVDFYVWPKFKTIFIQTFNPNLPSDHRIKSHAILRRIFLRPEYEGYALLSDASDAFQKSFWLMLDFNPLIVNASTPEEIQQRYANCIADDRAVAAASQKEENKSAFEFVQKSAAGLSTLIGQVPEATTLKKNVTFRRVLLSLEMMIYTLSGIGTAEETQASDEIKHKAEALSRWCQDIIEQSNEHPDEWLERPTHLYDELYYLVDELHPFAGGQVSHIGFIQNILNYFDDKPSENVRDLLKSLENEVISIEKYLPKILERSERLVRQRIGLAEAVIRGEVQDPDLKRGLLNRIEKLRGNYIKETAQKNRDYSKILAELSAIRREIQAISRGARLAVSPEQIGQEIKANFERFKARFEKFDNKTFVTIVKALTELVDPTNQWRYSTRLTAEDIGRVNNYFIENLFDRILWGDAETIDTWYLYYEACANFAREAIRSMEAPADTGNKTVAAFMREPLSVRVLEFRGPFRRFFNSIRTPQDLERLNVSQLINKLFYYLWLSSRDKDNAAESRFVAGYLGDLDRLARLYGVASLNDAQRRRFRVALLKGTSRERAMADYFYENASLGAESPEDRQTILRELTARDMKRGQQLGKFTNVDLAEGMILRRYPDEVKKVDEHYQHNWLLTMLPDEGLSESGREFWKALTGELAKKANVSDPNHRLFTYFNPDLVELSMALEPIVSSGDRNFTPSLSLISLLIYAANDILLKDISYDESSLIIQNAMRTAQDSVGARLTRWNEVIIALERKIEDYTGYLNELSVEEPAIKREKYFRQLISRLEQVTGWLGEIDRLARKSKPDYKRIHDLLRKALVGVSAAGCLLEHHLFVPLAAPFEARTYQTEIQYLIHLLNYFEGAALTQHLRKHAQTKIVTEISALIAKLQKTQDGKSYVRDLERMRLRVQNAPFSFLWREFADDKTLQSAVDSLRQEFRESRIRKYPAAQGHLKKIDMFLKHFSETVRADETRRDTWTKLRYLSNALIHLDSAITTMEPHAQTKFAIRGGSLVDQTHEAKQQVLSCLIALLRNDSIEMGSVHEALALAQSMVKSHARKTAYFPGYEMKGVMKNLQALFKIVNDEYGRIGPTSVTHDNLAMLSNAFFVDQTALRRARARELDRGQWARELVIGIDEKGRIFSVGHRIQPVTGVYITVAVVEERGRLQVKPFYAGFQSMRWFHQETYRNHSLKAAEAQIDQTFEEFNRILRRRRPSGARLADLQIVRVWVEPFAKSLDRLRGTSTASESEHAAAVLMLAQTIADEHYAIKEGQDYVGVRYREYEQLVTESAGQPDRFAAALLVLAEASLLKRAESLDIRSLFLRIVKDKTLKEKIVGAQEFTPTIAALFTLALTKQSVEIGDVIGDFKFYKNHYKNSAVSALLTVSAANYRQEVSPEKIVRLTHGDQAQQRVEQIRLMVGTKLEKEMQRFGWNTDLLQIAQFLMTFNELGMTNSIVDIRQNKALDYLANLREIDTPSGRLEPNLDVAQMFLYEAAIYRWNATLTIADRWDEEVSPRVLLNKYMEACDQMRKLAETISQPEKASAGSRLASPLPRATPVDTIRMLNERLRTHPEESGAINAQIQTAIEHALKQKQTAQSRAGQIRLLPYYRASLPTKALSSQEGLNTLLANPAEKKALQQAVRYAQSQAQTAPTPVNFKEGNALFSVNKISDAYEVSFFALAGSRLTPIATQQFDAEEVRQSAAEKTQAPELPIVTAEPSVAAANTEALRLEYQRLYGEAIRISNQMVSNELVTDFIDRESPVVHLIDISEHLRNVPVEFVSDYLRLLNSEVNRMKLSRSSGDVRILQNTYFKFVATDPAHQAILETPGLLDSDVLPPAQTTNIRYIYHANAEELANTRAQARITELQKSLGIPTSARFGVLPLETHRSRTRFAVIPVGPAAIFSTMIARMKVSESAIAALMEPLLQFAQLLIDRNRERASIILEKENLEAMQVYKPGFRRYLDLAVKAIERININRFIEWAKAQVAALGASA